MIAQDPFVRCDAHKTPTIKVCLMKRQCIGLLILFFASINIGHADNSTLSPNTTLGSMQVGAYIDLPQYNGSGCPFGKLSAALSPDQTAMSVLFDDYSVRAGGSIYTDRKSCDITIPFFVPIGYQVGIVRTDYRGFIDLPVGGQAKFKVEYFLAGENTLPYTEVFSGSLSDNFLLQDTVNTQSVQWSGCSTPVNFRINTDLSVYSNSFGDEAMSTLDSAEITINDPAGPKGLQFYFEWRPCVDSSASTTVASLLSVGLLAGIAALLGH